MTTTDPVVFVQGCYLVNLIQQPGPMPTSTLNRICEHLSAATDNRVRFDWHPIGGRPMLLYLGDHALAKATYLAEGAYLRQEADAYATAWYAEHPDIGTQWPSTLGLLPPEGPEIAEPEMITIGQAMNRERVAAEHGIVLPAQ